MSKEEKRNKSLKKQASTIDDRTSSSWSLAVERRDLWMNIARQSHLQCQSTTVRDLDMDRLMTTYDMTEDGLQRLFRSINLDNDDTLSFSEFKQGLSLLHLQIDNDKQIKELFNRFASKQGKGSTKKISFQEFSSAMVYLNLAALFNQPTHVLSKAISTVAMPITSTNNNINNNNNNHSRPIANFRVIDWNDSETYEHERLDIPDHSQLFFFGHRSPEYKKRWIMLNYPDPETILRISVKYRFHPVATEDLIFLSTQNATIKEYGPHNFFILPCVILLPPIQNVDYNSQNSKNSSKTSFLTVSLGNKGSRDIIQSWLDEFGQLKSKRSKYSVISPRVVSCNIAIFVAGPPNYDTIMTVQSPIGKLFSSLRSTHQSDLEKADSDEYEHKILLSGILAKLIDPHGTSLRLGNADWMFYSILNLVVEQYIPVITAYTLILECIQDDILKKAESSSYADIRSLVIMKKDLLTLKGVIRPMLSVIRHVMGHKNFSRQTKAFSRDIEDNLKMIFENIETNFDWCESLTHQYRSCRDERMNTTLSILTILTGVFIPAQFIAGVFGMNFVNEDGTHQDPMLRNPDGFKIFWILVCSCSTATLIFLLYLRYRRRNPEKPEHFRFKRLEQSN